MSTALLKKESVENFEAGQIWYGYLMGDYFKWFTIDSVDEETGDWDGDSSQGDWFIVTITKHKPTGLGSSWIYLGGAGGATAKAYDVPTSLLLRANIIGEVEEGVCVHFTGYSDETTNGSGYCEKTVSAPFTGSITPEYEGYAFIPENRSYTNIYKTPWFYNYTCHSAPPEKPINPTPEHESEEVDWSDLTLSWEDGGGADTYDVYFGNTILSDEWVFLGNTEDTSIVVPYTITGDNVTEEVQAYVGDPLDWMHTQIDWNVPLVWRVDARNEQGTTEGDVWWFDARPVKTAAPTPENSYTNMTLDWMDFEWTGAPTATSYDTYIRTEEISFINLINSSVLNSIDQSDLINAVEVIFGKNTADYDTNYYWRVDSKNLFGVFEGDSWMFTTIPFLPPAMSKYWNGEEWKWSGENFISTEKKLVAAANNRIWLCDDV